MAGLIMLGLIVFMVLTLAVMLATRQGKKRILKTLAVFLVIIGVFFLYVGKTCGPNSADVEMMKPQVEVITAYILKNDVPQSMSEIPNLPHEWNSCSKATDGTNVEKCFFAIHGKKYRTELYLVSTDIYIDIYCKQNETGIYTALEKNRNGSLSIRRKSTPYSTKSDGICNPMRM